MSSDSGFAIRALSNYQDQLVFFYSFCCRSRFVDVLCGHGLQIRAIWDLHNTIRQSDSFFYFDCGATCSDPSFLGMTSLRQR